ncbi:NAD(P)-dependent oxidoreductase [Neobacillus drentensis]|uniref:NAD-dependent epimerase/dehydratase family protein n=1 Tax=Neobacillus drentensis TaxID=220684 RepID=UPI002FFDE843
MTNNKVLISGANGFFGQIACEFFLEKGWNVLRATRYPDADFHFDLDQPIEFGKIKTDEKIDLFIHAAAAHEVKCIHQPYQSISQNILGTKAALDFCVKNKIKKFVYLSTFHVFGNPAGVINEETKPSPLNDYGLSHLQAEEYVHMYEQLGMLKGYVLRPTNFFEIPSNLTQFNRWTLVPFAFCKEAIEKKQIKLNTTGMQMRNFISVLDILNTILEIVNKDHDVSLLHLPGPSTFTIRELALLVKDKAHDYLNLKVNVILPVSVKETMKINSFNYESLYLNKIYKPKEHISEFVVKFLTLLNNKKQNS